MRQQAQRDAAQQMQGRVWNEGTAVRMKHESCDGNSRVQTSYHIFHTMKEGTLAAAPAFPCAFKGAALARQTASRKASRCHHQLVRLVTALLLQCNPRLNMLACSAALFLCTSAVGEQTYESTDSQRPASEPTSRPTRPFNLHPPIINAAAHSMRPETVRRIPSRPYIDKYFRKHIYEHTSPPKGRRTICCPHMDELTAFCRQKQEG